MVTVTKQLLEQGMSLRGSWNMAQLRALGVKTISHNKGWKFRLIGSKVTQTQVDEFLRLKNRHLGHKTRNLPFSESFEKEMYSHLNSIKQELRHSIA